MDVSEGQFAPTNRAHKRWLLRKALKRVAVMSVAVVAVLAILGLARAPLWLYAKYGVEFEDPQVGQWLIAANLISPYGHHHDACLISEAMLKDPQSGADGVLLPWMMATAAFWADDGKPGPRVCTIGHCMDAFEASTGTPVRTWQDVWSASWQPKEGL